MRLKLVVTSLTLTLAGLVGALAPASVHAATACVPGPTYWPTTGQVVSSSGSTRSITLRFTATQAQLSALACLGGYLKIDNVVQNAGVSGTNYTLSTNLPGATKEVPIVNTSFTPGATGIAVSALQPNQSYFVTVSWTGGNAGVTFSTNWIGAHWATSMFERSTCQKGQMQGTNAWCVFATTQYPSGSYTHSLTGDNVALGSTYSLQ